MERFPEYALDREKTTQILNSIKDNEIPSDEIVLMGVPIDLFKNRIPGFNQIFDHSEGN